jgi:hypothetical protein
MVGWERDMMRYIRRYRWSTYERVRSTGILDTHSMGVWLKFMIVRFAMNMTYDCEVQEIKVMHVQIKLHSKQAMRLSGPAISSTSWRNEYPDWSTDVY